MRFVSLVLLLSIFISPDRSWAQFDNGYGLSDSIQNRIADVEADYERMIQAAAPEFRLVRKIERFPAIDGKTVPVPVNVGARGKRILERKNSPPLIATIHDRRTGKPLDNCVAPCTLTSPLIPPGTLSLYRYGSVPVAQGAEIYAFLDPDQKVYFGFNEVDHQLERERCAVEFKVIREREPTRDIEACVRVPPTMPPEAQYSGHCLVVFNVSRTGETIDVRAEECTEQVFCEASLAAVQRWIYYPKLNYGETEVWTAASTTMTFHLTNPDGAVIPEPENEMEPCVGSV
jgi:hypothetical protein